MSDLLLRAHPDIKGLGVTLEPDMGGNVYLPAMDTDEEPFDRFYPHLGDVIDMARNDIDIKKALRVHTRGANLRTLALGRCRAKVLARALPREGLALERPTTPVQRAAAAACGVVK